MELIEVERADDPLLVGIAQLMAYTFVDSNTVLGLDRMQEFLAANERNTERRFHVLGAVEGQDVVGLSVFSYVPVSNFGFSEYIVAAPVARGTGLGRALFERRKAMLDAAARQAGRDGCRGLFIEADDPLRMPRDHVDLEREIDPVQRRRIFEHLGFWKVDVPYVQPPLGAGKDAVEYLDLLFAPWDGASREVSSRLVLDTLRPIWASWAPGEYQAHFERLARDLGEGPVALRPLI